MCILGVCAFVSSILLPVDFVRFSARVQRVKLNPYRAPAYQIVPFRKDHQLRHQECPATPTVQALVALRRATHYADGR